jgi:hypothetical protein
MNPLSIQITPEDAKVYSDHAKEQHERTQAATTGSVRVLDNSNYRVVNTSTMEVESISRNNRFNADDLARPGIVGSLGGHSQNPNAIVKLANGLDTTLQNAFNMGLIGKDSAGQYYDLGDESIKKNDTEEVTQAQQQDQHKDKPEPQHKVSEASLVSLAALSSAMPDYHLDNLIETAANHKIMAAIDGNQTKLDLAGYSQLSNIQENELESHVITVLDGFQKAADNILKSLGVDHEGFYQFLREEHPDVLKQTMRSHYFTKNANVWKPLVSLYRTNVLPTDEALRKAGLTVGKNNGESHVVLNGVSMSVKSAAKAGLI